MKCRRKAGEYRKPGRKADRKKLCEAGKLLLVSIFLSMALAELFQLRQRLIPVLILLLTPVLFRIAGQLHKKHRMDLRFEQCAEYMQQMLFAFERTGEIAASLREIREFFGEDEMGSCLSEALDYLEVSYSGNSKEAALRIIEEKFPNKMLKTIHKFLVEAENTGGRTGTAMEILKEELQRYRTRVRLFQVSCKKSRMNSIVAVAAGMLLCASLLYLTPDAGALSSFGLYQAGTVVLCVVSMIILYGAFALTSRDWLEEQGAYTEEELEAKLLKYLNNTQKVGRRTLKGILQKEINKSFPDWILKLTLLLQNRDVPGAIEDSIRDADVVLKYYLRALAEEIHDKPDCAAPYLEFLKEFKTPETENAMKMVYAISTGGCIDADKQLVGLFDRTQIMAEQAAQAKQETQMAKMYVLFLAPTLLSSLKLILDLSILLVSFMGQLSM